MPLRDHFRPPISSRHSWEGSYGGWPMTMVQHLAQVLPHEFAGEPIARFTEQYEYAVHIYDHTRNRRLVAAIEIVSPANKDRPETRMAFITKCVALWQQSVCVSIVDLVTVRNFNLHCEMLELVGRSGTSIPSDPSAIYAATCRGRKANGKSRLENWTYPLIVGQALPSLPIWLNEDFAVVLNLEDSYEATCRVLRIA